MPKCLKIGSLLAIALLTLTGCGQGKEYKAVYRKSPKTHKIHLVLPSTSPKIRGSYLYNISSDDINQVLHITQHHVYLQTGTNVSNSQKQQIISQMKSQYNGSKNQPSKKYIDQQWNDFVKENRKGNQNHLVLQIRSYKQDGNTITVNGITPDHHRKTFKVSLESNGNLKVNAKYARKSVGNIVNTLHFEKCTTENAESVLKDDKLNSRTVGYK